MTVGRTTVGSKSATGLGPYLDECKILVLEGIRDQFERYDVSPYLTELMLDYPLRGGKALRPALAIATCRALGGTIDAVLPSAATLELFHNAFLIHDDVEDESHSRRGRPTMHLDHGVPIAAHRGQVVKFMGDGVMAVFAQPQQALDAALAAQLELVLPVRMGLHCGVANYRDRDYFGVCVNRAARLMGVAHGGQIVVSQDLAPLLVDVELVDLGPHRLKDMPASETIFQVLHPQLRSEFPPLNAVTQSQHNLVRPPSTFIGRSDELDELETSVLEHRVVSIIGSGGAGKTRLATELAWRAVPLFADGVHMVELAALSDGAELPEALARAIGVRSDSRRITIDDLAAHYGGLRRLLVMDNCEHLLDEVADFVSVLLAAAPGLHVVLTSRSTLGLPGEQVVRPRRMDADDATQLFVQRANAARPDLTFSDDDLAVVGSICERLDQLPLAIELAAAQTMVLPVGAIFERLDSALDMTSTRRGEGRHRNLRDMVAWSEATLSADDRDLFRRLSVCRGAVPLEAIEWIGAGGPSSEFGALTAGLAALVDASLVEAEPSKGRYRLLEPVRQYAAAALATVPDDEQLAKDRHTEWVQAMVQRFSVEVVESRLDLQQSDLANIRVAVRHLIDRGDAARVLGLIVAGRDLWAAILAADDVEEWLRTAIDSSPELPLDLRIQAIGRASGTRANQTPGARAIELAQWAVDLAEQDGASPQSKFIAAQELANAYLHDDAGHPRTMEWCQRALASAGDNPKFQALVHSRIAMTAFLSMNPAAGLDSANYNVQLASYFAEDPRRFMSHGFRAAIRAYLDDVEGTLEDLRVIHDLPPSMPPVWRRTVYSTGATAWERLGDEDQMVRHLVPGLRLSTQDLGQVVAVTIGAVAVLATRVPAPLVAFSIGSLGTYHSSRQPMLRRHAEVGRARAIGEFGVEEFDRIAAIGRTFPLDEAHQLIVRSLLGLDWQLPKLAERSFA